MSEVTISGLPENPGLTSAAKVEVSQNGSSYRATVAEWNALLTADVDGAVEDGEAAQTAAEAAQAAAEVAQADASASAANAAQNAGLALTRANNAATSATSASTQATNASASATAAAASAAAAAATAASIAPVEMTRASTTSVAIATGSKSFTFTVTAANLGWAVGIRLRAVSAVSTSNFMEGAVTAVSTTSVTILVDVTGGSGTLANWNLVVSGGGVTQPIALGGTGATTVAAAQTALDVFPKITGDAALAAAFTGANAYAWEGTTLTPVTSPAVGNTNTVFKGWGNKYTTPGSISFNAVRIPSLTRVVSLTADKWSTIKIQVRACTGPGNGGIGAIIASGEIAVDPESSTLTNLVIALDTTLTQATLGTYFFVGYHAVNSVAGAAAAGETTTASAILYHEGDSYYTTGLGTSWDNNSNDNKIAIELISITRSATGFVPTLLKPALLPFYEGLLLPANVYAVAGRETNVYFANALPTSLGLHINAASTIGTQLDARWTVIPGSAASTTLTLEVYDDAFNLRNSTTATLTVAAATAAFTRKALFIGDSTTAAGTYTGELVTLDTADANTSLTLIGTQGSGANKHEGQGGWSVDRYYAPGATYYASNPFANPPTSAGIFDFAYYLSNTGQTMASGDWVFIHLGINDWFSATTDTALQAILTADMPKLEAMITSIRAAVSGIRIGLMLVIPPSASQDAAGDDYGVGQTRRRYLRNWFLGNSRYISQFDARTAENIFLVPTHLCLDTVNNMEVGSAVAVNSRNATTVVRQNNLVHPATSGYYQMADAIWAFLKCKG